MQEATGAHLEEPELQDNHNNLNSVGRFLGHDGGGSAIKTQGVRTRGSSYMLRERSTPSKLHASRQEGVEGVGACGDQADGQGVSDRQTRSRSRQKPASFAAHGTHAVADEEYSSGSIDMGSLEESTVGSRRGNCEVEGCGRKSRGSTRRCRRHGGGAMCTVPGCTGFSRLEGKCSVHGGAQMCIVMGCDKRARFYGRCTRHGGFVNCRFQGCLLRAVTKGVCAKHGGRDACRHPGCARPAIKSQENWCQVHGRMLDSFRQQSRREVEQGLHPVTCMHVDSMHSIQCMEPALMSVGLPFFCPTHLILARCGGSVDCRGNSYVRGRCVRHAGGDSSGAECQQPGCTRDALGWEGHGFCEKHRDLGFFCTHTFCVARAKCHGGKCDMHRLMESDMKEAAMIVEGSGPREGDDQVAPGPDNEGGNGKGEGGGRSAAREVRGEKGDMGSLQYSSACVSDTAVDGQSGGAGVWTATRPEAHSHLIQEETGVAKGQGDGMSAWDDVSGEEGAQIVESGEDEVKNVEDMMFRRREACVQEDFDTDSFFSSEARDGTAVDGSGERDSEASTVLYFGGVSRETLFRPSCACASVLSPSSAILADSPPPGSPSLEQTDEFFPSESFAHWHTSVREAIMLARVG